MQRIPDEIWEYFIKIIVPAFIASVIKIAVKMQKGRVTFLSGFLSMVIALGVCVLFGFLIYDKLPFSLAFAVVGAVAILSDKLLESLMYRINVDAIMDDLIEWLKRKLK